MMTLRRNWLALLIGAAGIDWFFLVVGGLTLQVALASGVVSVLFLPAGCFWAASLSLLRWVRLESDQLVAGYVLWPQRVPRAEVVKARPDSVHWLRGTQVTGIRLELRDGRQTELAGSQLLSWRRSAMWMKAINEWASERPGSDTAEDEKTS